MYLPPPTITTKRTNFGSISKSFWLSHRFGYHTKRPNPYFFYQKGINPFPFYNNRF